MFLEYNWTACCYQVRFHNNFISIIGRGPCEGNWRSFIDMKEAKQVLNSAGLKVGKKTASRTWQIEENPNA